MTKESLTMALDHAPHWLGATWLLQCVVRYVLGVSHVDYCPNWRKMKRVQLG